MRGGGERRVRIERRRAALQVGHFAAHVDVHAAEQIERGDRLLMLVRTGGRRMKRIGLYDERWRVMMVQMMADIIVRLRLAHFCAMAHTTAACRQLAHRLTKTLPKRVVICDSRAQNFSAHVCNCANFERVACLQACRRAAYAVCR